MAMQPHVARPSGGPLTLLHRVALFSGWWSKTAGTIGTRPKAFSGLRRCWRPSPDAIFRRTPCVTPLRRVTTVA